MHEQFDAPPRGNGGRFVGGFNMSKFRVVLLLTLSLGSFAAEAPAAELALEHVLQQLGVAARASELPAAPITGFLEVRRGVQVIYVSTDGRLLINGDILSLATEVNLTERSRAAARVDLIGTIPREQRIIAAADGPARDELVMFVDTNCPYCRVLHQRRAEFTRRGIAVHILFFPRSGPSSESYAQAVAVWCAANRPAALESALTGTALPPASCDNPVAQHYALAKALHLKGTPALVTRDGSLRYGVVGVEELFRRDQRADH